MSRAEFLQSFRQALISTVREGEIKQVRRRSREACEDSPFPTTSSIIAIPEETPKEALLRTNLADSFEEEARTTYLENIQATIGMESNRSFQDIVETNTMYDSGILEHHKTKRRHLND